ncbi:MAG: alpha/beta fold hydrolase, partial [Noviherbaspirillum sp.]
GRYEDAMMQAMLGRGASTADASLEKWMAKYQLQAHYLSQQCFTSEREVLHSAVRANERPTVIVHGTHDWICLPKNALLLRRYMPRARMNWIARGTHAASDPLIQAALREAIGALAWRPRSYDCG